VRAYKVICLEVVFILKGRIPTACWKAHKLLFSPQPVDILIFALRVDPDATSSHFCILILTLVGTHTLLLGGQLLWQLQTLRNNHRTRQ